MLPINVERNPGERLIALDEVPTSVISSNPFENQSDVVLQGDISMIAKGGVQFHSMPFTMESNTPTQKLIRNNLVENAERDLERSPNNPMLLNNLGLAYLGVGELERAAGVFSKALELKPDLLVAALSLATVHTIRNEDEKANAIYSYLLKENPKDTRVLMSFAGGLLRKGKLAETKTTLRALLDIDKKNVGARNNLAIVQLIEGNAEAAIKELRDCLRYDGNLGLLYSNLGVAFGAIGSYSKAIEAFKVSLSIIPDAPGTVLNLAKAVKRAKGLKEAIELLENFVESHSGLVAPKEFLAKLYIEEGSLKKAVRILGGLLWGSNKLELPVNETARLTNNLGVVFGLKGDWASAEKFYLESIKRGGYINIAPITNLIDLHFVLGRLQKAREYTSLLQSKFPDDRLYMFYNGLYKYRTHEIEEAIRSVQEFISDGNKFVPAYSLLCYMYSEYKYDYRKVTDLLTKAFGKSPTDLMVINNLAYNYLMNNDIRSAEVLLDRVGEHSSGVFITATKGLLEIKQGNINKGRELYNRAAEQSLDEGLRKQVMQKKGLEIARFYISVNNIPEAKAHLEKASKMDSSSVYAGQIKELLKSLLS